MVLSQMQTFLLKTQAKLKSIGLDTFLLLLLSMILLAYIYPPLGVTGGSWSLKTLASYGVGFIFFFYGLRLGPEKLKAGLYNWRLHIVVHLSTFVIFPLIVLCFRPLFIDGDQLWLGAFYLAALPSTVSSSVVMVSIAKGNLPAAIFNASISSLMGVFITPIWMSMVMSGQQGSPEMGDVIVKLIIQVLVPVVFGILLHSKWGTFAENHKKQLRQFDQSIILLIIYTSFCESFIEKAFEGFGWGKIIALAGSMVLLFFVVYTIIGFVSHLMRFNREDRITALFCGSKKSLVHGTVMSKVLFANYPAVGVLLLPTMLYHALQLIIVSVLAQRFGAEKQ